MKCFAPFPILSILAIQAYAQLTINTPTSIVQCEPVLISWSGGSAPYYLTIVPGDQPTGSPLRSWAATSGTSLTWNTDIAAGTNITLALRDNTGSQVYSSSDTIGSSPDSSCVQSIVNKATSSTSGAGSNAATTTGAATHSSSSTAAITTKATTLSTGSSTSSASRASSSSGAATHGTPLGAISLAGLGAVVAAVL